MARHPAQRLKVAQVVVVAVAVAVVDLEVFALGLKLGGRGPAHLAGVAVTSEHLTT